MIQTAGLGGFPTRPLPAGVVGNPTREAERSLLARPPGQGGRRNYQAQ
jgi:hypothetical protein